MGTCLATCCGSYCGSMCAENGQGSRESRIPYLIVLGLGMVLATVLRYWAEPWSADLYFTNVDICTKDACYGYGAAYRMSWTLFVFFALHALLMLSTATQDAIRRYWLPKIFLLVLLFFAAYWIDDDFFKIYSHICRFVSAIFLLLQIIILIDFAYTWNDLWISSDSGTATKGDYGVLVVSLGFLAGALTLLIYCFRWFNGSDCTDNKAFMGTTIALTSLALIISITSWCSHGALLPSAVMTLYAWYLCYSAMASSTDTECNGSPSGTAEVVISMLLLTFSVVYATWTLSNAKSLFGDDVEEVDMLPNDRDEESGREAKPDENLSDEELEAIRVRNLKFFLVLTAASMYMAMVLTNYGFVDANNGDGTEPDRGDETVWVKMTSQWVALVLYLWTLVAPQLFPDREW